MPQQEDENQKIKKRLNKALSRWWGRKRAIRSIIANATNAQKQEILRDADLVNRLSGKLSRFDMRAVLNNLNASIYDKVKVMHSWEGRHLPEIMNLIEKATDSEKRQIANNTAILSHMMTSYREDYQSQVVKHLNLLAAESFTNNPNNDEIGFTSLMVFFQDKIVISKEVNIVPAGTFVHDQTGFEVLKARFIAAMTYYLSDKYKLKIESADTQKPVGEYPIIVKLTHNPAAYYRMILHGGAHGRGHVRKLRGNIYECGQREETSVPDVYLAHEGAHLILGADDEYADVRFPGRPVYTDHSLMGDFYAEGISEAQIKGRHFNFLVPLLKRKFPNQTIRIVK